MFWSKTLGRFCFDVVSGNRTRLTTLPALLASLVAEPYPLRSKLAMLGFFVLVSVLPGARARALLAYRSRSGGRSAWGFAREIFSPGVPIGS